jgi:hypothetical protein
MKACGGVDALCLCHFTPEERVPHYPFDRSLGKCQGRSGRGGEDKNVFTLQGIKLQPSSS